MSTPATTRAVATRPTATDAIVGTFTGATATARLRAAADQAHLVSPATTAERLPEGCGIAMSLVLIEQAVETYKLPGGNLGLSKPALDRIAAASGVSWDPSQSGRLDDGRHPHYCHYRAVGTYRSFDGQLITISGEVEIDTRPGGAAHDEIVEKARQENRSPDKQLLELRKFLLRHAESKAKNRAIRSLGVRTSYTPAELERPFVVARVMFTGQTTDPELRRLFAEKTADAFLGARTQLYGRPPVAALPAPSGHAAPPPGASATEPEDVTDSAETETSPPVNGGGSTVNGGGRPVNGMGSGWTIPGGRSKGTPLDKADDRDLEYWSGRIKKDLDAGQARNPGRDTQLLAALDAEIARRAGADPQLEMDPGPDGDSYPDDMPL